MSNITLHGESVLLRALEPEDLDFLYTIENDEAIWHVSHTQTPFSRYVLRQYLENAHQDIYQARQLRLVIAKAGSGQVAGFIDLFDFDPQHRRAGVGVAVASDQRQHGLASEALELLIRYAFSQLQLHQLYCNITPDNAPSVALFTKFGFVKSGTKKDWNVIDGRFADEDFYQLINI